MLKRLVLIAAVAVGTAVLCHAANIDRDAERIAKRDSILSVITGARHADMQTVLISKLGAKGDGLTDCKPAFDKAMRLAEKSAKAAKAPKGTKIVVPAGRWLVKGPIHLVSNVCLELQEGATLLFDPNPAYYLTQDAKTGRSGVYTSWEGTFCYNYSPFIYGYGLTNVSITGKGTIDGNAATTISTWRPSQKPAQARSRELNHKEAPIEERLFGEGDYLRPHLLQLYNCEGVTLEDFFITNSPFWCVHLLKSENIICRRLRYDAKLVNNDGIDPEYSRNILIEDVEFNNGDDNVAIKAGRDNDGWATASPSENIIIRGCKFKGLHAVVLGSEMSAGVQNVFVEDCTVATDTDGTPGYCKRGIYLKTNPDRGGFKRNLNVNNCDFDEVEDLFYVTSMYAGEGADSKHFTTVENLYVNNLRCRKARAAALVLQGTEAKPIRNVVFSNVEVGEVLNAVSFDNTEAVTMQDCHLGGHAGVPTQVTAKDNLFK